MRRITQAIDAVGLELRRALESRLIRIAAWLLDRNVQRAPVTSRRDNNALFEMPYELRAIAERIEKKYSRS